MRTELCNEWFGSNKMQLMRGVALALAGIVFAGCQAKTERETEKIVIRGSNTFGEELAPRLVADFKKAHPADDFDLEFKGTSYGVGALLAGRCDIAAASRVLTTNELVLAKTHGVELSDHVIGSYSVAVIVSTGNPVGNLTQDQVRDIFTGVIQNWKDVGGTDSPIHVYIRDQISGTFLGFQELAMERKPYATGLQTFTSYAAIVEAVTKDSNGIGYASLDIATAVGVRGLSIDGVAPTAASVNLGKYPFTRELRLYTDKAKELPAAREFILFVQSPPGQQILTQMGFVPHP